jgi:hypothetical protein
MCFSNAARHCETLRPFGSEDMLKCTIVEFERDNERKVILRS